jgi:hypothetical protein
MNYKPALSVLVIIVFVSGFKVEKNSKDFSPDQYVMVDYVNPFMGTDSKYSI